MQVDIVLLGRHLGSMGKQDKGRGAQKAEGRQRAEERAERRAAALRANLRKRKTQQRGREDKPDQQN